MDLEFEISQLQTNQNTPGLEEIKKRLRVVSSGTSIEKVATIAVLANLIVIFCRPQYYIPVLATIQLPFFLSLFPLVFYLMKISGPYTKGMKVMLGFLALALFWGPFAINNRLAFEGFRNFFQLFIFVLFPLTIYFGNIHSLRKLYRTMLFIGFYLGVFALTHRGMGPGDFMGDENDLCLVLDLLIAFPLVALIAKTGMKRKLTAAFILIVILAAIISTISRGGFVGLLMLGAYFVAKTPYKVPAFLLGLAIAFIGFALAPSAYIKDMSTITNTNESTARARLDSWRIATEIWLQPRNIIAGVGTKNGPLFMGEYETSKGKNLWGRETHSAYFQLLLDYGLVGVILFLILVKTTLLDSIKMLKKLDKARFKLKSQLKRELRPLDVNINKNITADNKQSIVVRLSQEIEFCRQFNLVVIISFIGVSGAAAFISVLYYPLFWLLASFAGATHMCAFKLFRIVDHLEGIDI